MKTLVQPSKVLVGLQKKEHGRKKTPKKMLIKKV